MVFDREEFLEKMGLKIDPFMRLRRHDPTRTEADLFIAKIFGVEEELFLGGTHYDPDKRFSHYDIRVAFAREGIDLDPCVFLDQGERLRVGRSQKRDCWEEYHFENGEKNGYNEPLFRLVKEVVSD